MFVLDTHCDTPSEILRGRNVALDNEEGHVDIPKIRRGGIDGAFFALYIPASMDADSDKAYEYAGRLLKCVEDTVRVNHHSLAFATTEKEALSNKSQSLFSVFLGLENGSPLGESFDRLEWFYDKGVRYITLCHSGDNQICDSCSSSLPKWGGLSPFGRELIQEMNRIGMLVDISHVSDASFYDVLKYSDRPVVATHSCCRALAEHPRNLTDDMIRAMASVGGVVQINFYPVFLDSSYGVAGKRPSYKRIVDHIEHVVSLVGVEHVGIGSDFDGIEVTPEGMNDISSMPLVFDEMRLRGFTPDEIEMIAGGNFFRILHP